MELVTRCNDLDDARHDAVSRADLRRRKLWVASYTIRSIDVPDMTTEEVELFTELAFLSTLPAYRRITLTTYSTAAVVTYSMSDGYKKYFNDILNVARLLDAHGDVQLATNEDWNAWIASV